MNEETNAPHPRTWRTLDLVAALKRAEKKLLYHRKAEHELQTLCTWLEDELEQRARRACALHGIPYEKQTPKSNGALADGC